MKKEKLIIALLLCCFYMETVNAQRTITDVQQEVIERVRLDYYNLIKSMSRVFEDSSAEEVTTTESEIDHVTVVKSTASSYRPYRWPTKKHRRITSGYGFRSDPFTGRRMFHGAIDIAMPENTPVYAASEGTVERTGYDRISGNYVVINHGNTYFTTYAHLNRILIRKGEPVTSETQIGLSGNTGRSTGPHLHFQVQTPDGSSIDPLTLIK